jgi:hypothetical protein
MPRLRLGGRRQALRRRDRAEPPLRCRDSQDRGKINANSASDKSLE